MHIGYWWKSKKKAEQYEDQDVGGWIKLKLILEIGWEWYGLDCSGSG
jgi:hypothetical protein